MYGTKCFILLLLVEIIASHVLNHSLTQNHRLSKYIIIISGDINKVTKAISVAHSM
jgi:hypothetical protein